MHCERRLLTTLTARDVTDPGPVPIRVLDSGLLMSGTIPDHADEAVGLIGLGRDLLAAGEPVVDVVEATLEQLSVRSGHRWSPSRPVYSKIVGIV